jgi:hypothetical protein
MTPRMKHLTKIAIAGVAGIAIGIVVAVVFLAPAFPAQWLTLATAVGDSSVPSGNSVDVGGRVPVSYSSATIAESDIPAPHITALSGKAKFLSESSPSGAVAPLGYIVSVSADALDTSKLPEKYRKEKIIPTKGGPLTTLPLEQATYEVYFVFRLLDRDGFQLLTINSPRHNIESGKTTHLQAQTEPTVTARTASHTNKIAVQMVVDKCLSATSE